MLSLLIREDRHAIKKEYLLRFFLTLVLFLIFLLIIFGTVLFSFNVQIALEADVVEEQLGNIKNSSDVQSIDEMIILNKDIINKVSQFNILDFNQSDILKEVLLKNREGINLNLITVDLDYLDEGIFASIEVRGISKARNDLVLYQKSLSESEIFESAEIPFSSFAQNANIPFIVKIKTVELNDYFKNEN